MFHSIVDRVLVDLPISNSARPNADLLCLLNKVGADPTRESRGHFLKRAANHWNARHTEADEVLRESGQSVKAPATRPDMQRHIDWLIRYQVKGESEAEIATKPFWVSPDTVRVEIRRLAKLLDLKIRPGRPRGRPRKSSVGIAL